MSHEFTWTIRCWGKYVDYYYATDKTTDWIMIAAKRFQDNGKWYGL